MRSIAIVGAGQAGLPLALALLDHGYEVTVMTDREPDDVRTGKVMSSQCLFGGALQIERDLGLDEWRAECPSIDGIGLTVPHPQVAGEKLIDWAHRLDRPAMAVDQRIKMPRWMEKVRRRGGRLLVARAGLAELETLARAHDLVVVSVGKGDVAGYFGRDAERSAFDRPQRALALTYVHGLRETEDFSRVAFNLIPGVGEYFVFPALTVNGPCHIMVFEGVPGGPMDCWDPAASPKKHLAQSLTLLKWFLPWEAHRAAKAELTDVGGFLSARIAPTVRNPVLRLPSGKVVFGLGDAVVVNDPITGQGANSAMKASKACLEAILARGKGRFTAEWMQGVFDPFWSSYSQHVTTWTNALLPPPPQHILQLLAAAESKPAVARAIVNGFDHPPALFPWWTDPAACARFAAQ